MSEQLFPIRVIQPVQWGDMDAYQHVNNTIYLRWFETGRAAYFSLANLWQPGAPTGLGPIFASVNCRYKAPVTYPDIVEIGVRVKEILEDRYVMEHVILSQKSQRVVAEGDGVVVCYDYGRAQKASIPEDWRSAISKLESGARHRLGAAANEELP